MELNEFIEKKKAAARGISEHINKIASDFSRETGTLIRSISVDIHDVNELGFGRIRTLE